MVFNKNKNKIRIKFEQHYSANIYIILDSQRMKKKHYSCFKTLPQSFKHSKGKKR